MPKRRNNLYTALREAWDAEPASGGYGNIYEAFGLKKKKKKVPKTKLPKPKMPKPKKIKVDGGYIE